MSSVYKTSQSTMKLYLHTHTHTHTADLEIWLGRYVLAKKAASGNLPVLMRISRHTSSRPRRKLVKKPMLL